jgi:hypothetical protein
MSGMRREDLLCDGCLGTRRCWVCLGTGVVDRRHGGVDACARCYGSGKCTQCQPVSVVDLGSPFGLPGRDEPAHPDEAQGSEESTGTDA